MTFFMLYYNYSKGREVKQMKKGKKKAADTLKEIDSNLDIALSIITKLTLLAMGIKTLIEVLIP